MEARFHTSNLGVDYDKYKKEVYKIMDEWYKEVISLKYRAKGCNIDHIVPVSFGYFFDINPYRMNHYKNIQLLPPLENLKKGNLVSKEQVNKFMKITSDWKEVKLKFQNCDIDNYLDELLSISQPTKYEVKKKLKKTKLSIEEKICYYINFLERRFTETDNKLYAKDIRDYCIKNCSIPYGGRGFKLENIMPFTTIYYEKRRDFDTPLKYVKGSLT